MIRRLVILGASAGALLLAGCVVVPESQGTGGSGHSSSKHQDAKVPGTSYQATGNIPCSMGSGQPTGSCAFGVNREGNGSGTVTVTKPDGRKRVIFFSGGRATGADTSSADPGKFSASKNGALNIVKIGQERYEIPDAVIFGG